MLLVKREGVSVGNSIPTLCYLTPTWYFIDASSNATVCHIFSCSINNGDSQVAQFCTRVLIRKFISQHHAASSQ